MTTDNTQDKKKVKKLIRIEGYPSSGDYGFTSINFSFVSSPINGRKQISPPITCREYVNSAVNTAACCVDGPLHKPSRDAPIDFERLRLLIVHNPNGVDEFRTKLFNGKAILNTLEKVNDWKPSTIATVKHSVYSNAWLLTGPKEWMSQPQLLSLVTWVLRLSAIHGPIETDNFDMLEKSLSMLRKNSENKPSDISIYLHDFWDKLYIIMKYNNEIFANIDKKAAWIDVGSNNSFGIHSGLHSFVAKSPDYSKPIKKAQRVFLKLCKKHLPRKNPLIDRR